MHDLARFVLHFHFLLGVAGFQEGIDVRQQIECDRMRENGREDRLVRRRRGEGGRAFCLLR